MRIYVATTVDGLRVLERAGAWTPVELGPAMAVTPGLRAWYGPGDEEELEHAASMFAARASHGLAGGATARRFVAAADVPDEQVRPAPRSGVAAVSVSGDISLDRVAAILADPVGAPVELPGDPAGARASGDATGVADPLEDPDLLWYATQELSDLLR